MCNCCCRKQKEKKEYECAVSPEKCQTKTVGENEPVPVCCGKPMKPKK